MHQRQQTSRRNFFKTSCTAAGALLLGSVFSQGCAVAKGVKATIPVDAHLWVYASRYPPSWDCTPILDDVFRDLKTAGYSGIEVMESILKHEDAVERLQALTHQHAIPVTGTSYYGDMWDKAQQQRIVEDVENVAMRLNAVGGKRIGLTVGDAKRIKTETELDTQAETLKKVITLCHKNNITPNLHNHTFEVINNMHDLNGTLARLPDVKLGPDINWLVRGGVDPIKFIETHGHRMVYMHLRDQDAKGKWTEAVGEGVTNFNAIATALKKINYSGAAAVELAFDKPPKRAVRENWTQSRQYVKKVFGW